MNTLNILNTEVKTMTSKEICEVTSRPHNNTLKLIKSLIDKGLIHSGQFYLSEYTDSTGRKLPIYKLDEPSSVLVVARQSPEFTAALVKRWRELENQGVTQNSFQAVEDKTKVRSYDALFGRKKDINTTKLAKYLGTSAIALNKLLREQGIKCKHEDSPMAKYAEWFNVIPHITPAGDEVPFCLITPLGVVKITHLWYSYHNSMMSLPG